MKLVSRLTHAVIAALAFLVSFSALAQAAPEYFREEFLPPAGKGASVLVISGQLGPEQRRAFAKDVAALGYYVMLLDGNDTLTRSKPSAQIVRHAITGMLASPNNTSKKVAVVGFSMGGGGSLAHVITLSDLVHGAVLYYPATNWIQNVDGLAGRIQIPLLFLAAVKDTYKDCCVIDRAREIATAANAKGKSVELVEYAEANHGFDLTGSAYRHDYTRDAWKRTEAALKTWHEVGAK
ncbi:MAG: dienelactone hydrolase family protein [Burkholderiales bacterium]